MHNLKLFFLLLLTLAVAVAGFLLPGLTTQIVDSAGSDAVYSQDFTLFTSEPGVSLTQAEDSLRKLTILDRGNLVLLSSQVAAMKPEEVDDLATKTLLELQTAGLVTDGIYLHPLNLYLSVDPNDPTNHVLVWMVRFTNNTDKKGFHNLELLIDDETGKVLHLSYSTVDYMDNLDIRMENLTRFFFNQLELNGSDYFTYEDVDNQASNYIFRHYTLPGEGTLRTELQFEVNTHYYNTTISHYRAEIVEP